MLTGSVCVCVCVCVTNVLCVLCGATAELMGTPGYLAPEMLKVSVEDDAAGYGKEIDL